MLGSPKLSAKSPSLSFDTHIVQLWCMICPQTPKYIANQPMQHCAPAPCVDSFYTLSMDKNRHFLTPSPPHLVHIVIECPLIKRLQNRIRFKTLSKQKYNRNEIERSLYFLMIKNFYFSLVKTSSRYLENLAN